MKKNTPFANKWQKKSVLDLISQMLFSILVISSLYFGYQFEIPYVKFIPSTLAIVLLAIIFYRENWTSVLGLKAKFKEVILAFGIMIIFCAISYPVIAWDLSAKGYSLLTASIFDYLIVPFQTLNEEIIFRALFLGALLKIGVRQNSIVFFPAIIFSLFHRIFYSDIVWIENQGVVNFPAIVTLFMFGVATNALFLKYRNIYLSWALHCGWNIHRFGSKMVQTGELNPNNRIKEYMTFNLLEGGFLVMFLSTALAGMSLYLLGKNRSANGKL